MSRAARQAVLLTGVYGSGKTSVAEEMSAVFERRGTPYAAIDLDWLGWFDVGWDDDEAEHRFDGQEPRSSGGQLPGRRRSVLCARVVDRAPRELEEIRLAVPVPLRVARLMVDIQTIERRCATDPTSGRRVDIEWARRWVERDMGAGLEDFVVSNDRPLREVAIEVIDRLDW